jgi:FeS assembly SUF system regulator
MERSLQDGNAKDTKPSPTAGHSPGGTCIVAVARLVIQQISTKLVLVLEGISMLRMSRLTDYATVLLAALAGEPERVQTAASLAERTHIAAPTVSKLLKQLQRAGLVISTRGLHGGYQLARPAAQISAAAILDALEGPVALTDCAAGHGQCDIEESCRVSRVWQRLNLAIRRALYEVSLAQLAGLDAPPARLPALEREMKAAGARSPLR